jgi:hypothetical protein
MRWVNKREVASRRLDTIRHEVTYSMVGNLGSGPEPANAGSGLMGCPTMGCEGSNSDRCGHYEAEVGGLTA